MSGTPSARPVLGVALARPGFDGPDQARFLTSAATRTDGVARLLDVPATILSAAGVAPGTYPGHAARVGFGPRPDAATTASSLADLTSRDHVRRTVYSFFVDVPLYAGLALAVACLALAPTASRARSARARAWWARGWAWARGAALVIAALPTAAFLTSLTGWWKFGNPTVAIVLSTVGATAVVAALGARSPPTRMAGPRDRRGDHVPRPEPRRRHRHSAEPCQPARLGTDVRRPLLRVREPDVLHLRRRRPRPGGRPRAVARAPAASGRRRGHRRGDRRRDDGGRRLAHVGRRPGRRPGPRPGVRRAGARGLGCAGHLATVRPRGDRGSRRGRRGGVLDWLRPPDQRSHLGRFVAQVIDGSAWETLARKAATPCARSWVVSRCGSRSSCSSLPPCSSSGPGGSPTVVRADGGRLALVRPTLLALWIVCVAGSVVNDFGVRIAMIALIPAVPLLTVAALHAATRPGEDLAPAPTADAPEDRAATALPPGSSDLPDDEAAPCDGTGPPASGRQRRRSARAETARALRRTTYFECLDPPIASSALRTRREPTASWTSRYWFARWI
ncbi:hypothetical protein NKG05_10175 [Oerskovia sp. M15]